MPLMISRIVQARGRPVPFAAGRWGSITRHSSSVTSVWYRLALRLCFLRVVGVHMATPGLVSEPPGITSTPATQPLSKRPLRSFPPFIVLPRSRVIGGGFSFPEDTFVNVQCEEIIGTGAYSLVPRVGDPDQALQSRLVGPSRLV